MRRFARASFLPFAAWLAGLEPAVAGQAPPATGGWNVDWGDLRCSLIRRGEGASPSFVLQTLPGSRRWQVRLVSPAWPEGALDDADELAVTFQPGGLPVSGHAVVDRTGAGPALVIHDLPESLLESFAAAQSVRAEQGGRPVLEMALPAAARALAAVRECESSAMREWGIDPAAQPPVPPVPRRNLASLVQPSDYPVDALTGGHDGIVVFRVTVDAAGRVSDCVPIASSGHAGLDRQTCAIARRARFTPALGADGNPVPAATIGSLTWAIGRRTP